MELIAAADKNWAIGRDGKLLCHLPGELKYFKEKTTGKTVAVSYTHLPEKTAVKLVEDSI